MKDCLHEQNSSLLMNMHFDSKQVQNKAKLSDIYKIQQLFTNQDEIFLIESKRSGSK